MTDCVWIVMMALRDVGNSKRRVHSDFVVDSEDEKISEHQYLKCFIIFILDDFRGHFF